MAKSDDLFDPVKGNAAPDPLVSTLLSELAPVARAHYEAGILLDKGDFTDEQTYHRGRLARALAALFGHGTIAGLRVRPPFDPVAGPPALLEPNTEREIVVDPGLALDRLGRLIEVKRAQCFRIARWFAWMRDNEADELNAAVITDDGPAHLLLDFFIRFVQCEHGRTPSFATGPFNATDATAPSRDRDAFELTWRLRPLAERASVPVNGAPTPEEATLLMTRLGAGDAREAARRTLIDRVILDRRLDRRLDASTEPRPFVEQPDWEQVLLARVRIPVDAAAVPLALAEPPALAIDNYLRPFIVVPGRWLGG